MNNLEWLQFSDEIDEYNTNKKKEIEDCYNKRIKKWYQFESIHHTFFEIAFEISRKRKEKTIINFYEWRCDKLKLK